MTEAVFQRVLLKISGEGFCREGGHGIDEEELDRIARQTRDVHGLGVELAIVVGGGNIFRGTTITGKHGIKRATADYMGMLATAINALALQDRLESMDVETRVQTAIEMKEIGEPYIRRRCIRHLEKGRVVILACGTGNPYFTTDTTAALRGTEIEADVLLKATKVDGVFSADPKRFPEATRYDRLTFREVLDRDLMVMDKTAVTLCMENSLPIVVFNLKRDGSIVEVVKGRSDGTTVGTLRARTDAKNGKKIHG